MKDCYRAVVIFASSSSEPAYVRQLDELRAHAAELKERDMIVVPAEGRNSYSETRPADLLPTALFDASEIAAARARFKIGTGQFRILLVGKDGTQKLASSTFVPFARLRDLVDSMPMRQQERKDRSRSPQ